MVASFVVFGEVVILGVVLGCVLISDVVGGYVLCSVEVDIWDDVGH